MKHRKPTQKEIVLHMLEEAGDKGVHSFQFMQLQLPRVAARVCELRAEGHEISSEHELLHGSATGVRYRLQGGDASGTGSIPGATVVAEGASGDSGAPSELFPQTSYEHMQDAS